MTQVASARFGLVWLAWCCGLGCGGVSRYPVEGRVMIDGEPLTAGDIVFYPDHGAEQRSDQIPRGTIQPNGTYAIQTAGQRGAPLGDYRVVIVAQTSTRPRHAKPNPMNLYPAIPRRYFNSETTPLRLKVVPQAASGQYDLDLQN